MASTTFMASEMSGLGQGASKEGTKAEDRTPRARYEYPPAGEFPTHSSRAQTETNECPQDTRRQMVRYESTAAIRTARAELGVFFV